VKRGEVRWYTFRSPDKRRPVLVLTRSSAISYLSGITVAPLTTTIRNIPSETLLTPEEDRVPEMCVVNLDNVQTVQKQQLGALITTLSTPRMVEVEQALCFALGMDHWQRRTRR
jgi:mRNA interferase MazF